MPEKKVTRVELVLPSKTRNKQLPKKRVAAYARVSTIKDAQENSLQSQKTYYSKFIKVHSDWTFAGLYTDDGISGLSVHNRDGFNHMVEDALAGKIDMVLTKSLSRFARNTVDSLTTIRKLKAVGVAVYFEKENINTLDANGEFLITLMSSFAEEESRSISENVRWAYRHRFSQGIYFLSNSLLGYTHNKHNEPVIDDDEARIVRFIFMLALTGKSCTHITSILENYNIPAPLSDSWEPSTVQSILQNERYMGDAILQKTVTTDFLTKKIKKNEGEAPQYYVENGHPAIVSKEAWREVQTVLNTEFKKNCTYLPIARKIVCGDCKGLYGRKVWHSTTYHNMVWECNNKKAGRTHCTCPHIYDYNLANAISKALSHLIKSYPQTITECTDIVRTALPILPGDVLMTLQSIKPTIGCISIDNMAVSILILSITVTAKHNLLFRFIDGSAYRMPLCHDTSKTVITEDIKTEIIRLHTSGCSFRAVAENLGLNINTVRSTWRRNRLKSSSNTPSNT